MVSATLMSSAKDDWGTPDVIRAAVEAFGKDRQKEIVDPCPGSTPVGTGMANLYCPPESAQDGLKFPWENLGKRCVFYCNPPYGRAVKAWVRQAMVANRCGCEVIMLLASRTDTRWFHDAMRQANSALFIEGRLTFLSAPAPAPFPSVLLYFGEEDPAFARAFGHLGTMVSR